MISSETISNTTTPDTSILKVKYLLLIVSLAVLPLCFGAAHHVTWYLGLAGVSLLSTVILRAKDKDPNQSDAQWSRREVALFAVLALGATALAAYHLFHQLPHPLFGTIAKNHSWLPLIGFLSGLFALVLPTAVFSQADSMLLKHALLSSGILAAVVSLMHWGSDNGALFWIFSPEYVFETDRARWPFVNANHLAAFLLTPIGIASAQLLNLVPQFFADNSRYRASSTDNPILNTTTVLSVLAFPFCAAALLATQSRAGWMAAALLIGLLVIRQLVTRAELSFRERFISTAVVAMVGVATIWALLTSDRLSSLTANRIDYASAYSTEDVRFQYWSDAAPLLLERPLTGIGPGGFSLEIERVARPELSGLNPVYLHNDVYQLLLEYGVIIFGLCVFTICWLLRTISSTSSLILLSFLVVTVFDFPFRIGALIIQLGILIAWGRLNRINTATY